MMHTREIHSDMVVRIRNDSDLNGRVGRVRGIVSLYTNRGGVYIEGADPTKISTHHQLWELEPATEEDLLVQRALDELTA